MQRCNNWPWLTKQAYLQIDTFLWWLYLPRWNGVNFITTFLLNASMSKVKFVWFMMQIFLIRLTFHAEIWCILIEIGIQLLTFTTCSNIMNPFSKFVLSFLMNGLKIFPYKLRQYCDLRFTKYVNMSIKHRYISLVWQ